MDGAAHLGLVEAWWDPMTKGKTHCRGSPCNILRSNAANARRKARKKAQIDYDVHKFDGSDPDSPEAMPA